MTEPKPLSEKARLDILRLARGAGEIEAAIAAEAYWRGEVKKGAEYFEVPGGFIEETSAECYFCGAESQDPPVPHKPGCLWVLAQC